MKRIVVLLSIICIFSTASFSLPFNECRTDIYFGNGVWNDSDDAKENAYALYERIIRREIIKNDPKLETKYGKVLLAYNWGQGWDIDLVETFYQLKEAGQLSEKTFYPFR